LLRTSQFSNCGSVSNSIKSQLLEYAKKKYYPERFSKGGVVIVKENGQIMGIVQLGISENNHIYIEKFYK